MEIYSTNNLIQVVSQSRVPGSFLRSRYMPTSPRDIFKTKKVFIERKDDGNKAAPFVIPYSGSTLMEREGYTGEELQPAFINPSRDMTINQLEKKGIGETLYDDVTPAERELNYLADDLVYLQNAVQRTEEWMVGQIITKGYVDCKIGDANGTAPVRFQYFKDTFGNKMTFTSGGNVQYWGDDGVSIYEQVSEAANDIDSTYGALDLILGANLVTPFVTDSQMLKMLDVANANFGAVNPGQTIPNDVGYIGTVNFSGKLLNIYTYNASATVNGENVKYIDPDYFVVLPREDFGATKFGSITQMEEDDRQFHTYTAEMVPRVLTDPASSTRRLEMASAPLPHPWAWDSWRVCKAGNTVG